MSGRPHPQPVGPRATKEEFMQALRLVPSQPRDEAIYRGMRDEAIGVYNRLNSDRSSLVEQQRLDASIRPPFFWHHIRPERRRQAIVDTWQHARPGSDPRRFFDLGATAGEHAPNWVTLWLLYSVFRSRDVRNNRNRRTGEGGSLGGASGPREDAKVYDPARNQYRSR